MTRTFLEKTKEFLFGRQIDYRRTFETPHGEKVLADLAKFCRAHETTFRPDSDRASAVLEGRREVWLRIQVHLNLSSEQLWQLYTRAE
jgi:hypothetical protein